MTADLVIGIDSSTTACKAIAWTGHGTPVAEGRAAIPMSSPLPNYYEQDPADWWSACVTALQGITRKIDPARIAGLAITNQRETIAPVDATGQALRAGMVWLDERARDLYQPLAERLGREPDGSDTIHAISGKPVDLIPCSSRLYWMQHHEPEIVAKTHMFIDVQGALVHRLTGEFATSWSSADPLGYFDNRTKVWSTTILDACGVRLDQLPRVAAPGAVLGTVSAAAAEATGLKTGTPVIAGGGDGQVAGLGTNALSPDRAYLNIGTALVSGIYGKPYRISKAWRTMGSPTGEGYYYESCLRSGTFLVSWFVEKVCGVDASRDPEIFKRLESEAAEVGIGADGLLMVPYFLGVMSPYWDSAARGIFIGLSPAHGRGHMYRALMESLALEQAFCTQTAEAELGITLKSYVAIGGGASSETWRQIFADATGKVVERSSTVEATSLGAAMCAAKGVGWFSTFEDAAATMTGPIVAISTPRPDAVARYQELMAIYRELYPRLKELFGPLARTHGDGRQRPSGAQTERRA